MFQSSDEQAFTETWDETDNDGRTVKPGRHELTAESTGCDELLVNSGAIAVRFVEIPTP